MATIFFRRLLARVPVLAVQDRAMHGRWYKVPPMHRTSLVGIQRLEILGSLGALAASMLFGLLLIYLVAMIDRGEERRAIADFDKMFNEASIGRISRSFLEAASDVIMAGHCLAPGEA